jgi:hypothetical protein
MIADLTKYRNCVTHLQEELTQLSGDQQRWEDNFKLSRRELSSLYLNCSTNLQNLQIESEILTSLLTREVQTQQAPEREQEEEGERITEAQLVEMAITQLGEYDSHILKILKSELEEKESVPEQQQQQPPPRNNKRKSAPAPLPPVVADHGTKVFAFTPPSSALPSSLPEDSPSTSDDATEENIASIHSKLLDFLESWQKNGGAALNDEARVESRYSRVLTQLTQSSSQLPPAPKSSIHSGCLENEKEAILLASSPFPETEILHHLREYLDPNPSPLQSNPATAVGESHGSLALSRGTRRRKPMTTRHSQQSTQLQLTALRRTPRNQPLFLSPTSPFEDYYGGVILRGSDCVGDKSGQQGQGQGQQGREIDRMATVENLFSQDLFAPSPHLTSTSASGKVIPESLAQLESLVCRVNQSKACLQRGIRTLTALEREKIEWISQLEKLKQTSTKDLLETELGLMKPVAPNSNSGPGAPVGEKNETVVSSGNGGSAQKTKASGAASGKNSKARSGASSGAGGGVTDHSDVPSAQESLPQTNTGEGKKEIPQEVPIAAAPPAKETKKSSNKKPPAKKKSR